MTKLNDEMKLGEVAIRVMDIKRSLAFYTEIIGLAILEKNDYDVLLGVGEQPIIRLLENSLYRKDTVNYPGLYHTAILLPDEQDLGDLILHFIEKQAAIDGAGDHLYSQALYIHDPDGHGIEIYADRPRSEWTVNPDDTIESGTNPVNIERLIGLASRQPWTGLPLGTSVGHVHLEVASVSAFRDFYVDLLGMDVKTTWHNALFVSKGGYHHHIGANSWEKPVNQTQPEDVIGLEYFTIVVDNLPDMIQSLQQSQFKTRMEGQAFLIQDGNGIWLRLVSQ